MKMSRAQTRYFLGRLALFYSPADIAKLVSVSRPTMDRWLENELPSIRYLPLFREALEGLINKLDKHHTKWGFGRHVADVLENGKEPAYEQAVFDTPRTIARWLSEQLEKPMRTDKLIARARDVGFNKAQLNYAALKLGVVKEPHGAGRGSYSVWRLP